MNLTSENFRVAIEVYDKVRELAEVLEDNEVLDLHSKSDVEEIICGVIENLINDNLED